MILLQLAILGGLTAAPSLGYAPGARLQLQAENARAQASVWIDSANKYIGDGYSYGTNGHLRFGSRVWAGPGVHVSHCSTSQWDKTSVRPTFSAGLRGGVLQGWGTIHVWDTSPDHLRGLSLTIQYHIGPIVVQQTGAGYCFDHGCGWSITLLTGWRLKNAQR